MFGSVYRIAVKALPTIQTSAPASGGADGQEARGRRGPRCWRRCDCSSSRRSSTTRTRSTCSRRCTPSATTRTRRTSSRAFDYYRRLAGASGNSTAQYMLGLFYSTGIRRVVPTDQARALLYYTFAAAKGDTRAEMAVG